LNAVYRIIKHLAYRGSSDRGDYMAFRAGRGGRGILIKDYTAHEKMQDLDKEIGVLSSRYEYWLERERGITID